ncbi:hypothetical protein [Streptomyces sp. NPDC001315]
MTALSLVPLFVLAAKRAPSPAARMVTQHSETHDKAAERQGARHTAV